MHAGYVEANRMAEMASALIQEASPFVDSSVLKSAIDTFKPTESEVDGYLRCITISTDVMRLCLEPPDEGDAESSRDTAALPGETRRERWEKLLGDLRQWYIGRSAGLRALIERDGAGTTFPTVFFADDAGTCANMMYHIAMYVLLTHRPKSFPFRAEAGRAEEDRTHMSSLWHAQRVCGIGLTSDQQCWDPCMIAAFWLAARRMTHPDQQKDLVACLERLRASGWRVGSLIDRLRDEFLLPTNRGA